MSSADTGAQRDLTSEGPPISEVDLLPVLSPIQSSSPDVAGRTGARGAILVVESEPTIRSLVCSHLSRAGYRALVAIDGSAAIAAVGEQVPDLIVLDRELPDMSGLEVMRRVREHCDRMAIILLTDRDEESDHVMGLRLGAADCIVKPFYLAELVARIDAVLRRFTVSRRPQLPLAFDGLTIQPPSRRVLIGGEEVPLARREFDLLLFLARHPGQVFTRSQLMNLVWGYSFYPDTATVTVHIRRLRARLEPVGRRHIQTVWGVGYRFSP